MQKKLSRRAVKIPNEERLKNAALFYLSRYAASEASLRRVLQNRLRRAAMAHPDFAADTEKQATLRAAIETIIIAHKKTGAVNDTAVADMKVAGLRRAGKSEKFIRQKLGARGLAGGIVAHALREHDGDNSEEADKAAAIALCRKRRLGPFRPAHRRKDSDGKKDFGTLARAGFKTSIIRDILGRSFDEDLGEGWV